MTSRFDRIFETINKVKTNESYAHKCISNPDLDYRIHMACVDKWASCGEFACMDNYTSDAIKIAAIVKWPNAFRKIWRHLPNNESFLYATTFHHAAAMQLVTHKSAYVRSGCARFRDLAWQLKDDPDPLVRASACQWTEVAKYCKNDNEYCVIVARIGHFEDESLTQYTRHINASVRLACATRWLSCAQVLINDFESIVQDAARKHLNEFGFNQAPPSRHRTPLRITAIA